MNVNCDGNENICEVIITITFPCKQTTMKHDINTFNLTQFERRIYVYFFLWTLNFSIYLLPAGIWEESSSHSLVIWLIASKPYNLLNFIWSKTWRAIEDIS